MSGWARRRCPQILLHAVVVALFAAVSYSQASDLSGFGRLRQEQVAPPGTMAFEATLANPPTDEAVPELAESLRSAEEAGVYDGPYERSRHRAASRPEYCRSNRFYRSNILGRLWIRGEYLAWAPKGVNLPALVTGAPLAAPANTTVLLGNEGAFQEMSSGGRITGGFWWSPQQLCGIEANYFAVDGQDTAFYAEGTGNTILARPYLDVQSGLPASTLVAYPGVLDGAINVRVDTELSGAECLWRRMVVRRSGFRMDVVAGYRYGRLFDRVLTEEFMESLDPSSGWNTGTLIQRLDSFKTANDFHGGEFGLLARWTRDRLSMDVTGKVALGGTTTTTTIYGITHTWASINSPTPDTSDPGGLLAMPTNMGQHSQNEFAVMSELEVALRYEVTCDLWLRLGYNLLGWSHVGRAADQIDAGVNPSQALSGNLVGDARPAYTAATSSFWAQGLTVGLEHQF